MDNIIERLRRMATIQFAQYDHDAIQEAADQIEGLRDEIRNAYRDRDDASRDWEQAMHRVTDLEQQLASRAAPEGVVVDRYIAALVAAVLESVAHNGLWESVDYSHTKDQAVNVAKSLRAMLAAAPQPDVAAGTASHAPMRRLIAAQQQEGQ